MPSRVPMVNFGAFQDPTLGVNRGSQMLINALQDQQKNKDLRQEQLGTLYQDEAVRGSLENINEPGGVQEGQLVQDALNTRYSTTASNYETDKAKQDAIVREGLIASKKFELAGLDTDKELYAAEQGLVHYDANGKSLLDPAITQAIKSKAQLKTAYDSKIGDLNTMLTSSYATNPNMLNETTVGSPAQIQQDTLRDLTRRGVPYERAVTIAKQRAEEHKGQPVDYALVKALQHQQDNVLKLGGTQKVEVTDDNTGAGTSGKGAKHFTGTMGAGAHILKAGGGTDKMDEDHGTIEAKIQEIMKKGKTDYATATNAALNGLSSNTFTDRSYIDINRALNNVKVINESGYGGTPAQRINQATDPFTSIKQQIHAVENPENVTTKNKNGYEGTYQFRYRDNRDAGYTIAKKLGIDPKGPKTAAQQDAIMNSYLESNATALQNRGHEASTYNLWLAHNQGAAGANGILTGKLTKKMRDNIRNQGVKGTDDASLIANYHKKFKNRFSDTSIPQATSNRSAYGQKIKTSDTTKNLTPRQRANYNNLSDQISKALSGNRSKSIVDVLGADFINRAAIRFDAGMTTTQKANVIEKAIDTNNDISKKDKTSIKEVLTTKNGISVIDSLGATKEEGVVAGDEPLTEGPTAVVDTLNKKKESTKGTTRVKPEPDYTNIDKIISKDKGQSSIGKSVADIITGGATSDTKLMSRTTAKVAQFVRRNGGDTKENLQRLIDKAPNEETKQGLKAYGRQQGLIGKYGKNTQKDTQKAEKADQLSGALRVGISGLVEPAIVGAAVIGGRWATKTALSGALKKTLPDAAAKVAAASKKARDILSKGKGTVSLATRRVNAAKAKKAATTARKELDTLLDKTLKPQVDKIAVLRKRLKNEGKLYSKPEKAKIGAELSSLEKKVKTLRNNVEYSLRKAK